MEFNAPRIVFVLSPIASGWMVCTTGRGPGRVWGNFKQRSRERACIRECGVDAGRSPRFADVRKQSRDKQCGAWTEEMVVTQLQM